MINQKMDRKGAVSFNGVCSEFRIRFLTAPSEEDLKNAHLPQKIENQEQHNANNGHFDQI